MRRSDKTQGSTDSKIKEEANNQKQTCSLVNQQHQGQALHGFLSKPGKMICLHIRLLCVRKLLLYVRKLFQCIRKLLLCTKKVIVMNSSRTEDVTKCYMRRLAEQAGAELGSSSVQLKLGSRYQLAWSDNSGQLWLELEF